MATKKDENESKLETVWDLSLTEKLMRIQTEMKAPKNLWNDYGKYKYRSAEGILEAFKPFAKAYGVVLTISDEIINVSGRFYVKAIATLTDAESAMDEISATAYAREDETKKGMDGAQITGSASSYARKYALNALFLLDDSNDIDSTESAGNATQAKSEPQKASPAQATAKGSHTREEIKAKYQELISFCKENGYDLTAVCSEYKLNAKSSFEEFENVLRRLRYNLAMNPQPVNPAPAISEAVADMISSTDAPCEIT